MDRREFIKAAASASGAALLELYPSGRAFAEPPPETTRIRILHADRNRLAFEITNSANLIVAEQFVASCVHACQDYDGHPASRGRAAVLCTAAAGSGHDQSKRRQDYRQGTDWRFLNELKKELKA